MSINVRQFGFLSPSDLTTIITPRSEELVRGGGGDMHHMTDLTQQHNNTGRSHTTATYGPTDAATAARRRLIATNKPPTRILLPGIDPTASTSNTPYHQRNIIFNTTSTNDDDIFTVPQKGTSATTPEGMRRNIYTTIPTQWGPSDPSTMQEIGDRGEVGDSTATMMAITDLEGEPTPTTKTSTTAGGGGGVKVPLPPAPYSPRTDPRIKPRTLNRYTTSTQRGEFHQNRLVGMALRKRLSATDGAIADVLVRNSDSAKQSSPTTLSKKATTTTTATTQMRIMQRPTRAGGALQSMDSKAEELEVAGFEALGVNGSVESGGEAYLLARIKDASPTSNNRSNTLPTIHNPGQPPLGAEEGSVTERSHAMFATLMASASGTQKGRSIDEGSRDSGGRLALPHIIGTSPRQGSTISMGVLREREIGAVTARKEVAALAARAAAQLGLVEAMSSLATPKEVLPSRCTYESLHPLDLIRELPTSLGETSGVAQPSDRRLAPQGGGGGGGLPCANIGWELFLDNLHPTTVSTSTTTTASTTHALAKSVRVSPKRSNQIGGGIASTPSATTKQAMNTSGKGSNTTTRQPHRPPQPRHNNGVVSHTARAPTSSSTSPTSNNNPEEQQLWSWGALERLAMAQAQSEGTARARCLPGRNAAMSEEAALRRAQLDREAVLLARQEATGGTLTANERRRRTTILASRNPSRLTEDNDDDGVSRASDMGARSTALANLALYEADPTLFSVLGEDTCVVEFPTFPFASDRETAAFRILQEAHQGSSGGGAPVQGGGGGAKKVEDAEAEKKRLERAVMARYLYTNREAFDQQDKPSDDWRVWKRSAGAVAAASASPVTARVRHGRGHTHNNNTEVEEEPMLAPSEVLDKVDLEDRLTVLWQVSQRGPRNMEGFIQTQLRAGRDAAKDAEEEVKPYPANRLI